MIIKIISHNKISPRSLVPMAYLKALARDVVPGTSWYSPSVDENVVTMTLKNIRQENNNFYVGGTSFQSWPHNSCTGYVYWKYQLTDHFNLKATGNTNDQNYSTCTYLTVCYFFINYQVNFVALPFMARKVRDPQLKTKCNNFKLPVLFSNLKCPKSMQIWSYYSVSIL